MEFKKNDFIEIEFTGKVDKTEEIFDSNIKEDLEKSGLLKKGQEPKPYIFALGHGMFLPGIEEFLLGKPVNSAEYKLSLEPTQAFGERQSKLVQLIPIKIFTQNKLNPIPGISFNFDGMLGKVLSVSGGRVMVDFNPPLAGKKVHYQIKVLRKVEDLSEKVKSFVSFLFRRDIPFEIESNKLILKTEKAMLEFTKLFEGKFKELFNLDLEVKEIEKDISKK